MSWNLFFYGEGGRVILQFFFKVAEKVERDDRQNNKGPGAHLIVHDDGVGLQHTRNGKHGMLTAHICVDLLPSAAPLAAQLVGRA